MNHTIKTIEQMSAVQYLKATIFSFVVLGGAWQLYCMTPAGAAEREYTRQQKEMARQALQEPIKSAEKRNI